MCAWCIAVLTAALILALLDLPPSFAQVNFSDVTASAGVATRSNRDSGLASGSAWGDYNNDGWPDLFVGNHFDMPVLYKNLGNGRFANVTATVMRKPPNIVEGVWGDQHGAAWADVDNDGDQDLMVLVGAQEGEGLGPNQLYRNTLGHLTDCAQAMRIDYPLGRGRAPTWLDYDNDGRIDLFEGAEARPDNLAPPTLFRNGTTSFADVRTETNFKPLNTLGIWISDLNRDGRMEIIFKGIKAAPAAPRSSCFNILQTTTATSTRFRDVTPISFRAKFPDIIAADVNGDLRPDLFVCNDWALSDAIPFGNDLYLNLPTGFVRYTTGSGINKVGRRCRPSAIAADFDNDMDIDLFYDASRGSVMDRSGGDLANVMLWNSGHGTFVADATAGGAVGRLSGWGDTATAADYDGDGFVDLYLTYDAALSQLYRNHGNSNHWLEIDLVGTRSNADGVGAQVLVTAGGTTQLREQTGGIHRLWGQNHQRLHFGLGANTRATEIVVQWPSGRQQHLSQVDADQVMRIVEPD